MHAQLERYLSAKAKLCMGVLSLLVVYTSFHHAYTSYQPTFLLQKEKLINIFG